MKRQRVRISAAIGLGFSGMLLAIAPVLGQHNSCAPEAIETQFEQLQAQSSTQNWDILIEGIVQCRSEAVPFLAEQLGNPDSFIRGDAVDLLAMIGSDAIPTVQTALSSPDDLIRAAAAEIAAEMGLDGVVLLEDLRSRLSQEANPEVLETVIVAVAEVSAAAQRNGVDVNGVVVDVLKLLDNQPISVRREAIATLGILHVDAPLVVPALTTALQDPSNDIKGVAAQALEQYGFKAKAALPDLVKALEDADSSTSNIVKAMVAIANAYLRAANDWSSADTDKIAELESVNQYLQQAITQLEGQFIGGAMDDLDLAQNNVQTKLENLKGNPIYQSLQWVVDNPWIWLPIAYFVGYLGIFAFRPLWLLKLDEGVSPASFEMPLLKTKLSLRALLWLKYHPRVLDAWVKIHLEAVAADFAKKDTVSDRAIHISMPVTLDGKDIAELTPAHLKATFTRSRGCLLICSEGGAGKTSLACQIAKWGLGKGNQRLCNHLLLPVLVEQEPCEIHTLQEVIRTQLPLTRGGNLVSDELLKNLLKQRRVLVIIDHFSEMGQDSRTHVLQHLSPLLINALIITSRVKESLNGMTKTELKPMRVQGNRLSWFMDAYLESQHKRNLLADEDYFTACCGLTRMVGDRDITLLLARLYADQLIATLTDTASELPNTIPELMLSYLNRLNRQVEPINQREPLSVHQDAKRVAWQCLKQTYQPKPAARDAVRQALATADEIVDEAQRQTEADNRLTYLEKRLRLIQTVEPGNQIQFMLAPLAEYLAAMELVDCYSRDAATDPWSEFLQSIDRLVEQQNVSSTAIQGFLLAVRDCCLVSPGSNVPDAIIEEIEKRVGIDPET